jgi:hypothetical protein
MIFTFRLPSVRDLDRFGADKNAGPPRTGTPHQTCSSRALKPLGVPVFSKKIQALGQAYVQNMLRFRSVFFSFYVFSPGRSLNGERSNSTRIELSKEPPRRVRFS